MQEKYRSEVEPLLGQVYCTCYVQSCGKNNLLGFSTMESILPLDYIFYFSENELQKKYFY